MSLPRRTTSRASLSSISFAILSSRATTRKQKAKGRLEGEEPDTSRPASGRRFLGRSAADLPRRIRKPDLLRTRQRRGVPVNRAFHHLPHLVEPPPRVVAPGFTPRQPGAAIRARQTQFHLLLIHVHHIWPFT